MESEEKSTHKWEHEIIKEMGYPEYAEMMRDVNHLYSIALNYPSDDEEIYNKIVEAGQTAQKHIRDLSLEVLALRDAVQSACVNAMVGDCDPDVFIEEGRKNVERELTVRAKAN